MKILNAIAFHKNRLLFNQSDRSRKIILSASNSFAIKLLSILSGFWLVSVSINYIQVENYGVWLTVSSIMTWITIFDIGLVSSLRNKITEAITLKDPESAKKYTSTTYALLFLIITPVWMLFFIVLPEVNWQGLFHSSVSDDTLQSLVFWVFTSFCVQFFLKPIISILTADQKHTLANSIYLFTNALSLLCLVFFKSFFTGSLYLISLLFAIVPCAVLLVISLLLFATKYRQLRPGIATIDFSCRKDLLNLGFKFFIIQIAGLIIFSSNNFIISYFLGNEQVTYYNIVFRYFSVVTIAYSLVNSPFWTAYTDAYTVKDWAWIRKVTKQANLLCVALLVVTLLMLVVSSWVYKLWINPTIEIPLTLSVLIAINVGLSLFASTYTSFINGTGKIRLQAYFCVFVSLAHVPLGYFFIKVLQLGLDGLIVLTNIWALISLILWSTQYKKIIDRSTSHIWN
ncbi:MAG: MATE family efflux transporter [Chitinophagaceae bacterium]